MAKEYIRPMPGNWWMHNRHLILFQIRELTAVFVGGYVVYLLVMLWRASQGQKAFDTFFTDVLASPASMVLQFVALGFVLYHTYTWFALTPKAIVVYRGEERLPASLIVGANWVFFWIVTSAIIYLATSVHPRVRGEEHKQNADAVTATQSSQGI